MKISKQNNFVKMYQAMYPDKNLPKNICPLFWSVIIGSIITLCSPLILIPGIIRKTLNKNFYLYEKYEEVQLFSYFILDKFLLFFWLTSILYSTDKLGSFTWWYILIFPALIITLSAFVISLTVIISVIQDIDYNFKINKKLSYNANKKPSVIKEGIKSWWNKVCPLIEYKD
jgi:hypothetical protein